MDELYPFNSSPSDYPMQVVLPENIIPPPPDYHVFQSPGSSSFPAVGSDHLFSGSSESDTASMVAEMQRGGGAGGGSSGVGLEEEVSSTIRAKIASHPLYPKLLQAYIDCQKVLYV